MILIIGLLLAMSFFSKDEGTGVYRQQGILIVIITVMICIGLIIIATAKFWYTHLWKRNSNHARRIGSMDEPARPFRGYVFSGPKFSQYGPEHLSDRTLL